MIPPFACAPVFKEKVWGGQALRTVLGKDIPDSSPIGESWELSGYGDDISTVAGGALGVQPLEQLADSHGAALLGTRVEGATWPLLYKFIDANDRLSVQVHPTDEQAVANSWDIRGKTECWYIVHAKPDARIIVGVKESVSAGDIERGVADGTVATMLNEIPIADGDVLYIPAGTVHAIMEGTLLYEVQETSDITLRLYDWGRMGLDGNPRPLHVDESLEVLQCVSHDQHKIAPLLLTTGTPGVRRSLRAACRYFALEEFVFDSNARTDVIPRDSFQVVTCIAGDGELATGQGTCTFARGDTCVLPAASSNPTLAASSGTRVLLSWVPDIAQDVVEPALSQGISPDSIAAVGGHQTGNDLLAFLA